jgi:hypothetical protein
MLRKHLGDDYPLIKVMDRLRCERLTSNLDFSDSHLHG